VPPADPDALRRAILDAYHAPEKRTAFTKIAILDLDRFSMELVAREYLSLYQSLDM
jgi:glycosyltransferase involved in cell wall biosynthesis